MYDIDINRDISISLENIKDVRGKNPFYFQKIIEHKSLKYLLFQKKDHKFCPNHNFF